MSRSSRHTSGGKAVSGSLSPRTGRNKPGAIRSYYAGGGASAAEFFQLYIVAGGNGGGGASAGTGGTGGPSGSVYSSMIGNVSSGSGGVVYPQTIAVSGAVYTIVVGGSGTASSISSPILPAIPSSVPTGIFGGGGGGSTYEWGWGGYGGGAGAPGGNGLINTIYATPTAVAYGGAGAGRAGHGGGDGPTGPYAPMIGTGSSAEAGGAANYIHGTGGHGQQALVPYPDQPGPHPSGPGYSGTCIIRFPTDFEPLSQTTGTVVYEIVNGYHVYRYQTSGTATV